MAWIRTQKRKNPATSRQGNYYSINWRDQEGRVRQRALGFITQVEANKALTVFEGRLAAGELVDVPPPRTSPPRSSARTVDPPPPTAAPAPRPRSDAPLLGKYLDTVYLPRVKRDKSKKTWMIRGDGAVALKRRLANVPIDQITFRVADDYVTERSDEVRSRTLQLEMTVLRQALDLAVQRGDLEAAPKLPSIPLSDAKQHKFLSVEESKLLLRAMDPERAQPHDVTRGAPPEQRDQWSWLAVLIALNTGMRTSEILTREWSDVQWNRGKTGVLVIGPKPSVGFEVKMKRPRVVPLTKELREPLEKARGWSTSKWIFPSPSDPKVPRKSFAKALANGCVRAGLEPIHPHGLRHTWASRLASQGEVRRSLMEIGGWKSSQLLDEVYTHATDEQLEEVMLRSGISAYDDDASES